MFGDGSKIKSWIFVAWFCAISVLAVYNLNHNSTDTQKYRDLEQRIEKLEQGSR